jgi:hypothetical protein
VATAEEDCLKVRRNFRCGRRVYFGEIIANVLGGAGSASHESRAACQSQDSQGARPRRARDAARPRRRGDRVRRREFITLLGGAAAWPLAARAQQPGKLPTIGFLGGTTASVQSQWTSAFVQRLRELGWIEGRTVNIEYRWADGRDERAADIASEFARLGVNVIVTGGTAPILAATRRPTGLLVGCHFLDNRFVVTAITSAEVKV